MTPEQQAQEILKKLLTVDAAAKCSCESYFCEAHWQPAALSILTAALAERDAENTALLIVNGTLRERCESAEKEWQKSQTRLAALVKAAQRYVRRKGHLPDHDCELCAALAAGKGEK